MSPTRWRCLLVALAVAHGAGPAAATTIWDAALAPPDERARRETYDLALAQGDAAAEAAADVADVLSLAERTQQVGAALAAYRRARVAWPDGAEAAYRLGLTAFTYFVRCPGVFVLATPCRIDRGEHALLTIEAWDDFSRLAPLDPRATSLLFERALLHTRAILYGNVDVDAHLRAAAADYQARLDRAGGPRHAGDPSLGNLAEVYMMLGDLERAIPMYRAAAASGAGPSQAYGLAVALDRDEQGAQAREVARAQGVQALQRFRDDVASGDPFFVPPGEAFYYFALVADALGLDLEALEDYDRFIASGAYPRYEPRARAARAAVAARLAARVAPRRGRPR